MAELGIPHGPHLGGEGEDYGLKSPRSVDLLPVGRTLGIRRGLRRTSGLHRPREMSTSKLIKQGFPKLTKTQEGL